MSHCAFEGNICAFDQLIQEPYNARYQQKFIDSFMNISVGRFVSDIYYKTSTKQEIFNDIINLLFTRRGFGGYSAFDNTFGVRKDMVDQANSWRSYCVMTDLYGGSGSKLSSFIRHSGVHNQGPFTITTRVAHDDCEGDQFHSTGLQWQSPYVDFGLLLISAKIVDLNTVIPEPSSQRVRFTANRPGCAECYMNLELTFTTSGPRMHITSMKYRPHDHSL